MCKAESVQSSLSMLRACLLGALGLAVTCAPSGAGEGTTSGTAAGTTPGGTVGSAPALTAAPAPPQEINVAIPAQSLSTFPLMVGREAGIFTRHGITLNVVTMASNTAIAAAISGGVDYATPAGSIIRAINSGAPMRVVVAVSDKSNHILVVDPRVIREGKDLAGKTIAVNEIGGNTHYEAYAALQRFGLDKDSANYVGIVDNAQRLAALEAGAAQAIISNVPFNFAAERLGMRILVNFADFYELPTAVLGTAAQKIETQGDAVQRVVTATLEALRYTRSQKAEAVQLMAQQFDMAVDEAAAAYDLSRDTWSGTGRLSQSAYENALDPADLAQALPIERAMDSRFVDAAR